MAESLRSTLEGLEIHLPDLILQAYEKKGITELFNWQRDLLKMKGVVDGGKNLVYSANTSAGKSLVAELVMMSRFFSVVESEPPKKKMKKADGKAKKIPSLETKKDVMAIIAVPFVSMAKEKADSLRELTAATSLKVVGQSAEEDGADDDGNIFVCTFENANNVLNRLISSNKANDLETVVVDEIHMLGHEHRGVIVEMLISKLLYLRKELKCEMQIIAMSATVSNLKDIGNWLHPAVIEKADYRKTALKLLMKIGTELQDKNAIAVPGHVLRTIVNDDNHVAALTLEIVLNGGSVLVFSQNKLDTERIVKLIGDAFEQVAADENMAGHKELMEQITAEKLLPVVEALYDDHHDKEETAKVDGNVLLSVKRGVAYHHADLSRATRHIIEAGYRQGRIKVLVATSTLCAGVNLPARRVIIMKPTQNLPVDKPKMMDPSMFIQVSGRAGRTGFDEEGDCVLICPKGTGGLGGSLISSKPGPVTSKLINKDGELNQRLVLEAVVLGLAIDKKEAVDFYNLTYMNSTNPKKEADVRKLVRKAVQGLRKEKLIKLGRCAQDKQRYLYPREFGTAVVRACVRQENASEIRKELEKRQGKGSISFTTCSELTCVVPRNITDELPNRLNKFLGKVNKENLDDADLANCGLTAADMKDMELRTNRTPTSQIKGKDKTCVRYAVAQVIQSLQKMECPFSEAAKNFEISTGTLTNMITSCASYASHLSHFSREMKWTVLAEDLKLISSQLTRLLENYHWIRVMTRISVLPFEKARSLRRYNNSDLEALAKLEKSFSETLEAWAGSQEYSAVWKDVDARKTVKKIKKEAKVELRRKRERDEIFGNSN